MDPSASSGDGGQADERVIAAALEQAHLPSLMAALVHLTGDASDVTGDWRPVYDFFGDGQGGLPEPMQTTVRAQALEAIVRCRSEGAAGLAQAPSRELVRQMMNFVAGQPIPEHYLPFLLEELDLASGDVKTSAASQALAEIPLAKRAGFDVLIVGAGMSGILAAIRLEQAGIPYIVVEKNSDVGGTWCENNYPGCRVDTPNHLYSYSFGANHAWPQHYSTQSVLLDYFRSAARDHGVMDKIRFRTEVEQAVFDETSGTWRVRLRSRDGGDETLEANALISAVGQLNRPKLPDIPGLESFAGVSFHSAAWEHEHDFRGKRVAVIGTGASAFQFVPEIADQPSQLSVFQRSAPWLGPTPNYHDDVPEGMKWLLEHVPFYEKWYRFWLFWMMTDGILPAVGVDPAWHGPDHAVSEINDGLRMILTEYIRSQVGDDPELFAAAVPDYPPGGKRMLRDNGVWFAALKRDNVRVITRSIREVTARGIITDDGTLHEFDVIIYGTGFHASDFLSPMKIAPLRRCDRRSGTRRRLCSAAFG